MEEIIKFIIAFGSLSVFVWGSLALFKLFFFYDNKRKYKNFILDLTNLIDKFSSGMFKEINESCFMDDDKNRLKNHIIAFIISVTILYFKHNKDDK